MDVLKKLDIKQFHLLKEDNPESPKCDLAIVEGAITTKEQLKQLKEIRANSRYVVALGACACHGGIPAMRNFIENKELGKYVYNQKTLDDSIEAEGIGCYIKVDYYMKGCPIMKDEFVKVINTFVDKGTLPEPFKGSVCDDSCPKRGKDCFLAHGKPCLGAVTHGGCGAICIHENIPCVLCRGPIDNANIPAEIKLFEHFGLSPKDVKDRLTMFASCEIVEKFKKDIEGLDDE